MRGSAPTVTSQGGEASRPPPPVHMPFLVKMTFALPEQVQPQRDADGAVKRDGEGRVKTERVPGHPTRPARGTDCNCWFEPLRFEPDEGFVDELALACALKWAGAIVREAW